MPNTLEWLTRLVAFDTTSRNSNLELIGVLQEWFKLHGVESHLTHDPNQPKANLFATLPAIDGSVEGGIILSGHTDVVPVDGQDWATNPFEATLKDEKVFGRGTCDMKGFIAVTLALLPEFQQMRLKQPVHFAFSYDEEVGCRGAPLIIDDLVKRGLTPKACIVGEPTDMRPVVAHKGIQAYRCRVHGHAVHSSLTPQGCNAIEYAARLICYIRDLADEMQKQGPFDKHFDVPYTSISTNMIQGGIANNIVPSFCEFFFEFRNLPEMKPRDIFNKIAAYTQNELEPRMRKENEKAKIEIDNIAVAPSFESDQSSVFNAIVNRIRDNKEIYKVAYATEAGLFESASIPTIVCGPGNIEQAHRPDEFVTIAQLKKCKEFLRHLVVNTLN